MRTAGNDSRTVQVRMRGPLPNTLSPSLSTMHAVGSNPVVHLQLTAAFAAFHDGGAGKTADAHGETEVGEHGPEGNHAKTHLPWLARAMQRVTHTRCYTQHRQGRILR